MKVIVALCVLVAMAHSSPILPYMYSAGLPITYSAALPAVAIQPQITTYSLKPIEQEAEAIHPGYVAITPGAKHVAALPYAGASHHVNLAKAPGTK